jgi:hypothetical protein
VTADRQLWLLVEQGDGFKFPQPKACSKNGANWECAQVYNLPGATTDYRLILVIADQEASKSLGQGYVENHRPKDATPEAPGSGFEQLPQGATETNLILTGLPVAPSDG